MKKTVNALVLIDLVFLSLLLLSGVFSGAWQFLIYLLSYVLPITVGFVVISKRKLRCEPQIKCRCDKLLPSLMLFPPIILVIIGISALTSLFLSMLGKSNVIDVSGNLFYELFRHALLPAMLEEMLFRYIPLKLLLPYSRRGAIFVSALMFSLIHLNIFQLPYALFAGVALGFVTLLSGSIVPSVILHFLNNAISVFWMRDPDVAPYIIIAVLCVLTVASAIYIVKKRRNYKAELIQALSGDRVGALPALIVMTVFCLIISLISL